MSKIIDFNKLTTLELAYKNNNIAYNALQQMVNYVLNAENRSTNSIAYETLENLGVIKNSPEPKNESKQLNS